MVMRTSPFGARVNDTMFGFFGIFGSGGLGHSPQISQSGCDISVIPLLSIHPDAAAHQLWSYRHIPGLHTHGNRPHRWQSNGPSPSPHGRKKRRMKRSIKHLSYGSVVLPAEREFLLPPGSSGPARPSAAHPVRPSAPASARQRAASGMAGGSSRGWLGRRGSRALAGEETLSAV